MKLSTLFTFSLIFSTVMINGCQSAAMSQKQQTLSDTAVAPVLNNMRTIKLDNNKTLTLTLLKGWSIELFEEVNPETKLQTLTLVNNSKDKVSLLIETTLVQNIEMFKDSSNHLLTAKSMLEKYALIAKKLGGAKNTSDIVPLSKVAGYYFTANGNIKNPEDSRSLLQSFVLDKDLFLIGSGYTGDIEQDKIEILAILNSIVITDTVN